MGISQKIKKYMLKTINLYTLILAAFAYFAPVGDVIFCVFIFILTDFIAALWVAKRLRVKLESCKMRRSIDKVIWYITAVLLVYILTKVFSLEWSYLPNIVGGAICGIELKSIFENIAKITNEPIFLKLARIIAKKTQDPITEKLDPEEKKETNQTPGM
jgi:hypothetical protein